MGNLKTFGAKIILLIVGLAVGFLFLEFLTTAAVRLKIIPAYRTMSPNGVYHDILGYALPPHSFEDTDANGFRNPGVPESADIVTLGDSQTYGFNALSADSWPSKLEKLTGRSVYNMGMGGYGPVQYYYLADKALSMRPKLVILGFYAANDMSDACRMFALDYWKNFAKEKGLDVEDCLKSLDVLLPPNSIVPKRNLLERLRDSARDSSFLMLLKQVPAVSNFISHRRDLKWAEESPNEFFVVNNGVINTIFSIGEPGAKIGFDSPNIKRGAELAKYFLGETAKKIKAAGAELLIVFIPDKPDVLEDYLVSKGYAIPENYKRNIAFHEEVQKMFTDFFKQLNVPTVDVRSSMVEKIGDKKNPIFNNYLDSHPFAIGYEAMAESIAEEVERLFNGPKSGL
ncbi:MAG: SGNH/GDSL hydrolase family protein [Patescibacteria group bacterium]